MEGRAICKVDRLPSFAAFRRSPLKLADEEELDENILTKSYWVSSEMLWFDILDARPGSTFPGHSAATAFNYRSRLAETCHTLCRLEENETNKN